MNRPAIERLLRSSLPGLLAIYAFGSRIDGMAGPDRDLDLAGCATNFTRLDAAILLRDGGAAAGQANGA